LIVDNRLKEFSDRLNMRRIRLCLEDHARDHLSDIGYSPIYGARPLARIMREHVLKPLAKMILRGDVKEGEVVTIKFNAESRSLVLQPSAIGI
jgi:ATP-dependent Clp protease ATP-binding subunit ClpA